MELILVGIISGIITGIGMGGGNILILVLVAYMGVNQFVAQSTNLIFFIPTVIIAILIHIKKNNVEKDIAKKLFLPSVIGSAVGAYCTTLVDSKNLKQYLGFFLLVVRNIWNNFNNKRT